MSGKVIITNARIVTEQEVIDNGHIVLSGGKIESIGAAGAPIDVSDAETIDAKGGWVLPGFVDVHVHGGYGADFMDASRESLDTITKFHSGHGTTSIVATSLTGPKDHLSKVLDVVNEYRGDTMPYAQVVGVHLEGPFINVKYKGAQNPAYIVPPQKDWLEEWVARYPGLILQLSLAPETEGALELISWLRQHGINAAAAHTDATYDQVIAAADAGLNQAVHTFNAMTGLHHRNPGTVGAVMTDDRICAEIIADGHHVHPACIRLLTKAKTDDNLVMITDAMSAAGLEDGIYDLGGLAVNVSDGVATLKEGNSLAGSTLTMMGALRYVTDKVGVTVPQASRYMSGNPARQLGIFERTGSLEAGKQADVLLVSPGLELERVWVLGNELEPFRG
ncbi:N-acetylglucosamine-6-phosphate deacetylase [Paenibacillus hemerocallicola]|uniref:N-acetylglucosamine-6-phosphate deacetylase n=1 Tax=Paenibacillus hemerocallicola TaxID=1172614 RepID=A0A5C4SVL2_9BACL|nr:N-acetylglucosamine-6-phosphate deacetylase [Paenibacillus hemerocallicola]TNJ55211.1 N-acetylglucosamine-6-phosphate deacetylase [Paenibacillus hemerocallicola]